MLSGLWHMTFDRWRSWWIGLMSCASC